MSVDQAPTRPAPRPKDGAKFVRYHDYIDEKIESTRRLVKVVDLGSALVALAVGVLLFLMVVTVLEHWVVRGGISTGARWVLFIGLAAYVAYFAYRRLWPLCVHAINPVYAAQTIEHGSPALKNGLINLLIFRQKRSEISDAVYRTLEEQAAQGLTRVEVDSTVDQSHLIRLGYVLIAIVAVAALYKVLSPKDPFVTAERVLMPWANVVPASRVSISAITPGVTTISRGEFVDVSAEIRGFGEDDVVALRYTTDDGQIVGRAIPMKAATDGLRFTCRLTDEGDSSASVGLTRSVKYWLEAGDARSLNYPVTVVESASMLVEKVDYDYPAYTGYLDRSVEDIGDIRAIEGTRITLHARANGSIREANVDFDADGRRDLQMSLAEVNARATFNLELRDDRQTPRHASYVLRFTNDEGRTNHDPVKHAIIVEPDRAPEAELRQPQEKSRDARADENVGIEVEARDPDFQLAAVRLRGDVGGREVINEPLLAREQTGQFLGRYALTPSAKGLKSGDVLEYWIEADDNRAPKPNTTLTERKVLRIVSPNPAQQPPPGQVAQNDRQPPQPGDAGKQQPQNGQQSADKQGADKQGGGNKGNNAGEQQQGAQGEQGQQGEQNQGQQSNGTGKEQGKGSQSGQSGGEAQQGEGGEKNRSEGAQQNGGKSDASGKENQKDGQGSAGQQSNQGESPADQPKQKESQGKQTGAGAAGGESSKDGAQPDGARPDADKGGEKSSGGNQRDGKQQAKPGDEQTPVSSEGDNDAEAFNRIQKHLEKNGELKNEDAGKAGGEDAPARAEKQGERQGDKEKGRQGESKGDASQSPEDSTSKDKGQGAGAETRGDDVNQKQEPRGDQQQQEKSPGGQQTSSKGSAGDGNEEKSQGAPNSQQGMKPKEKPEQVPSKGDKSNQQEPPAGANSKKESDSHGDQGGDKAGGGEEGGGQKAPREGTGSAGQNQSADNGGGRSGEKGKGDESSEGGQDAKSDKQTGASDGKTAGKGSQQKDGEGDKSGGKAGEKQGEGQGDKETGRQGEKQEGNQSGKQDGKDAGKQNGADSKNKQDSPEKSSAGGESSGSGQPGGATNPSSSITGEAPEGDAANLEYARKQTDLVLDKLADQLNRKRVDDGLLKDLGWSEADLKKFLERWQQRKAAADRNDETGDAAKRELDDALRSLGLQRGELKQNAVQKDSLRDLREGYRGPVPAEYKDRLRAYNQGVSRAHRENE